MSGNRYLETLDFCKRSLFYARLAESDLAEALAEAIAKDEVFSSRGMDGLGEKRGELKEEIKLMRAVQQLLEGIK